MTRLIAGVDIGGTNVVVGLVPEDGTSIHGVNTEPTHKSENPEDTFAQVERMVGRSIDETKAALGAGSFEVVGVGIGAPGPLDRRSGTVLVTPNLGWVDMPLRDGVSSALNLPATLENDANCAIYGEWWKGAAQRGRVVVGLTIGTGVGGGIVIDGEIFHGSNDAAGEIGHASIDTTGRRCKCGNYGCLEAYAAGPAIAARAVEGIEAGASSSLVDLVDGDLAAITAKTVSQAAIDGDHYSVDVIRETAHFLGSAVANLVNIFNPDIVVICGGVTLTGDYLFEPLRHQVVRRAFAPSVAACRIVPGALPSTAGVYGAAKSFMAQTGAGD
jgi:glucokinase